MFRKLLATYERIGTVLYRYELSIGLFSGLMLFVGAWLGFGGVNKAVGMWLICCGIWGGASVIFSNIYALKEESYIDGEVVPSSEMRNTNSAMGYYGLIFTTVWIFVGCIITVVLFLKTIE